MEGVLKLRARVRQRYSGIAWKPPNLQKELGLRESHVARSRCRRAPALLAGEVARPDVRLHVGVMGSDDINERRSAKNELQR